MIVKSDSPTSYGNARAWRAVLEAAMTEERFTTICVNLFERAESDNVAAIAVRDTLIGRPRPAPVDVSPIELPPLTTLKGCIEALAGLAHAQNQGQVNEQTAEHLRSTIASAMQGHRQDAGERALEQLESQASTPQYLTPEERVVFDDYRRSLTSG